MKKILIACLITLTLNIKFSEAKDYTNDKCKDFYQDWREVSAALWWTEYNDRYNHQRINALKAERGELISKLNICYRQGNIFGAYESNFNDWPNGMVSNVDSGDFYGFTH